MARKKDPPKPLFTVKADFIESLDRMCQEAVMLLQSVDMAIRHGGLPEKIAPILKERADAFRATLTTE